MLLQNLTWKKAKEAFKNFPVVVVPVASMEQHGTALPVGTDYYIGTKVAQEATDTVGAVCTPTVPVGVSPHHRQFHGTLWAPMEVFVDYLTNICLSLKEHGIRKIIIANSHGGNTPAVREVIYKLRKDHGMLAVEWEWWDAIKDDEIGKGMWVPGHGGAAESSPMLAFFEDLVDKKDFKKSEDPIPQVSWLWFERMPDGRPVSRQRLEEFGAKMGRWDLKDFTKSGYTDNPALGDKKKGIQMMEKAKEKLVKLLLFVKEARLEDYLPQPHEP